MASSRCHGLDCDCGISREYSLAFLGNEKLRELKHQHQLTWTPYPEPMYVHRLSMLIYMNGMIENPFVKPIRLDEHGLSFDIIIL